MKFRIIEYKYSDGSVFYYIQKRIFWLFWKTLSEMLGMDYYENIQFNSIEECEEYITNLKIQIEIPKSKIVKYVE